MITKDFNILRGDPTTLVLNIAGDYSAERLIFVCKANKVLTSARLIEKKNVAAGGAATQLTATAASNNTIIKIFLDKIDTEDFTNSVYYWDLTAQAADQLTDPLTLAGGTLPITFDVQTDYDNTDLPDDAERYIAVLVSQISDGYFIKRSGAAFVGYNLATVISQNHTHTNKATLDLIDVAFTSTLKTAYDGAVTVQHSHTNKATLDLIDAAFTSTLKSTYDGYATSKQNALGFTPENAANKSAASGYCELDSNQKIPTARIPDSILGQVEYKGTWNATTNVPELTNPDATAHGNYYIVSTGGTQFSLDFAVGDWCINSNGTWLKVDNTDAVSSVHGRTGAVVGSTGDYTADQITETATRVYLTPTIKNYIATATGTTGINTSNLVFSNTPTLTTPILGVATATSLAIGGGAIGSNALHVTGTSVLAGNVSLAVSGYLGFVGNAVLGSTNYALYGNSTTTYLNVASGGTIGLNVGNNPVVSISSGGVSIGGATIGTNALAVTGTSYFSGNVGIGITPTNRLHVYASSTSTVSIFESGQTSLYIGLKDNTGNLTYLGTENGTFKIQTPGSSYSDKLTISNTGNATFAGSVLLPNGTAAAPAMAFSGTTNTGFHYEFAGLVTDIAGNRQYYQTGTLFRMSRDISLQWSNTLSDASGSADLILARDAANTLALRNSTNAQTFNVYNTYTDPSNYERLAFKWNSNIFEINAEKAGTGSYRNIKFVANANSLIWDGTALQAGSDNVRDLGLSSTRFRTGYFGTSVITPAINNGGSGLTIADNVALPIGNRINLISSASTGEYSLGVQNGGLYPLRLGLSYDNSTQRHFEIGYYAGGDITSTWNPKFKVNGYTGDTTINGDFSIASTKYFYLAGSSSVDGSWRMSATASGSCVIEARISGTWTAKQTLTF
jgi:hypothetical protein